MRRHPRMATKDHDNRAWAPVHLRNKVMTVRTRTLVLGFIGLGLIGCGSDDDAPVGPVAPGGDPAGDMVEMTEDEATEGTGYVQPGPWSELNTGERFAFMSEVVTPQMKALFQSFAPEAFADFSCATCHGDNAGEVNYQMPNGIAPLNLMDFPLTASDDANVAAVAAFMQDEVSPQMAALLGYEPFSPDNPMGFGCFGCHGQQ